MRITFLGHKMKNNLRPYSPFIIRAQLQRAFYENVLKIIEFKR